MLRLQPSRPVGVFLQSAARSNWLGAFCYAGQKLISGQSIWPAIQITDALELGFRFRRLLQFLRSRDDSREQ